ncbi:MAG TPA: hypothetical protein VFB69_02420 [Candidatus Dormibacteraeota bacterium]|nr:hypothetical protein [Candidatus Dormibacteraeota bacterium]
MSENRRPAENSGAYVGAALLIVIGGAALIGNLGGSQYVYESVPLALGVAFFIAYAATRQYGFLVPAGILTGVGAGVLAGSIWNAGDGGPYAAIGGGLGFILIYALDVLTSRSATRWWPVVPGALMVVIGSTEASNQDVIVRQLAIWSPALLIAIGVFMLVARMRRRTS